jgi:hypothetical protein
MTTRLQQAIDAVKSLPEEQQDAFAEWMLAELEDEAQWQHAFEQSAPQLQQLAKKALADYRSGKAKALK